MVTVCPMAFAPAPRSDRGSCAQHCDRTPRGHIGGVNMGLHRIASRTSIQRHIGAEHLSIEPPRTRRNPAAQLHPRGVALDARDVVTDRARVLRRQRGRGPQPGCDPRLLATARVVAGVDMNQVRPGGTDILLDALLGAVAERHHRHHRRDADDHSEHGQDRAQLVAVEAPDREADAGEQHGLPAPYSYLNDWIGSRRAACFAG